MILYYMYNRMCEPVFYPILRPRTKPAMNDARCWKSAVKKSINQFHADATVGGRGAPPGFSGVE